jgi:hypothetical protein
MDGLRKAGPRQLSLAIADSPSGGGMAEPSDVSERRSFLLHKARIKKTTGSTTGAGDNRHLLEEVASEANLAKALLSVVRNKGAPGLDGHPRQQGHSHPACWTIFSVRLRL